MAGEITQGCQQSRGRPALHSQCSAVAAWATPRPNPLMFPCCLVMFWHVSCLTQWSHSGNQIGQSFPCAIGTNRVLGWEPGNRQIRWNHEGLPPLQGCPPLGWGEGFQTPARGWAFQGEPLASSSEEILVVACFTASCGTVTLSVFIRGW